LSTKTTVDSQQFKALKTGAGFWGQGAGSKLQLQIMNYK
jgi:hypothetical protein